MTAFVSHYSRRPRVHPEHRFRLHHGHPVGRIYLRLRRAGLSAFEARTVVVRLLQAGQFGELEWCDPRPTSRPAASRVLSCANPECRLPSNHDEACVFPAVPS